MSLPLVLELQIKSILSSLNGDKSDPIQSRTVSGGSINQAAMVSSEHQRIFVKWNHKDRYPGMFETEAKGLTLLGDTGNVFVPQIIEAGEAGDISYLAMEYIEGFSAGSAAQERFGKALAALHKNRNQFFGLDHDNYMGSLIQSNKYHDSCPDFFINERLLPQIHLARNGGDLSSSDIKSFERLFQELPSIIPEEPPALVHGDLWCGNYITTSEDRTYLIDPAVCFAHREVDIAMSKLFGGFDKVFYRAYNEEFPLIKGWENRIDIFQLYPLLIHVNLFGGGYVRSVKSIISRF